VADSRERRRVFRARRKGNAGKKEECREGLGVILGGWGKI